MSWNSLDAIEILFYVVLGLNFLNLIYHIANYFYVGREHEALRHDLLLSSARETGTIVITSAILYLYSNQIIGEFTALMMTPLCSLPYFLYLYVSGKRI